MTFVLDSSALIEVAEGRPMGEKILSIVGEEEFNLTSITIHEVLVGVSSPRQKFVYQGLFAAAHIFEHDRRAAEHGASIEKGLREGGALIGRSDIFILAICAANKATLVTVDKDFKKIKGHQILIIE